MRIHVDVKLDIPLTSTKAAEAAARVVFPELNSAFQAAIVSKVWNWERATIRSDGQPVTAPRNIVDTGILKASNAYNISGRVATFKWSVDYAAAVHYGADIHPWGDKDKPKVNLPARPWTSAVLGTIRYPGIEPFDYRSELKAAYISAWRRS